MGQSFLFFLLLNLLTNVLSATTGNLMQGNIDQRVNAGNNPGMYYEPSDGHSGPVEDDNNNIMTRGAGYYYQRQRPALIASSTHRPFTTNPVSSIITVNQFNFPDTCGGTVNIQLNFNRLLPYKSTHFPSGLDYPMICNWNFTVIHGNCRRALVTMRLDGRSRLPDVDGCRKGYYRVSPIMKGARICGRIGDAPPFQWYVDAAHQSAGNDVTVVTMKNMGINDGYNEGLSFTLQGECVHEELYDSRRINVDKENARLNRRWMNRVFEDFAVGEGPRIVMKPLPPRSSTSIPITSSASRPTTAPVIVSDYRQPDGIPWLILKSPNISQEIHPKSAKPLQVVSDDETIILPVQLEIPISTTYYIPSTTEPITDLTEPITTTELISTTTMDETESTDEDNQFLLTTSTPFVTMETTTDNDMLSTDPSTVVSSSTTLSSSSSAESQVMIETTLEELALSDDEMTSPTTSTEGPTTTTTTTPIFFDDPLQISGPKFVLNLLQKAFQRKFRKFLQLFS
uniref:CUB domain-containing protein n=1 Tax=Daphnia galeata TaxID=27404 RepID=A0A8J2RTV6_9CRUS|nr:unnamed protein product [Daphnia galeata]